jgi:hypothetical protein
MTRALLLVAAVVGLFAGAAARAGADSVGTLQVNMSFLKGFGPIECAAGTPATTQCFHDVPLRGEVVSGLGDVTFAPLTFFWENFGSPCGSVHELIPILVAGKGEIDLAVAASGCWAGDNFPVAAVTVSGGSGRYAGAPGGGTLEFHTAHINGPQSGNRSVTWTGTLNVAGLAFDTTAPQVTGATSKVVKTRLAKGARVSYSVKATDTTDGPLAAACLPKSGSLFPVGRTTVSCNPTDSSGNSTTARLTITVKRVH